MAANTPYAHVQAAVNTTLTTTTSRAQALTNPVVAGNAVIGWIWMNGTVTTPLCSDSLGQTYTTQLVTTGSQRMLFFWKINSLAGTPTVTASWTTTRTTSPMVVHEFSGIPAGFGLLTGAFLGSHKTTGVSILPGAINTSGAGNVFAFAAMWNSGANTLTNPPTANPAAASNNNVIQSSGLVSNSLYADTWCQLGVATSGNTANLGFTVSSSTEVSDVAQIFLGITGNGTTGITSYVQQNNASSTTNVSSSSITFTAGNLVCVSVTYNGGVAEESTRALSDTQVNTWVEAVHGYNTSQKIGISLWYCLAAKNNTATVLTTAFGGSVTAIGIQTSEFAINTGIALDGSSVTSYTSTTTNFQAGSYTTTAAGFNFYGSYLSAFPGLTVQKSDQGLLMIGDAFISSGDAYTAGYVQPAAAAFNGNVKYAVGTTGIAAAFAIRTASVAAAAQPNFQMMMGCGL